MFVPLSYHILKRILVLFAVLTLLSSCASMFNQPHTSISLYTTQPSVIVQNHDTLQTTDNKASLLIERKREPLMLILTTDSIKKTIRIEPGNSLMYWSNILFNYGLGMLYDKNKPKRYGYPLRLIPLIQHKAIQNMVKQTTKENGACTYRCPTLILYTWNLQAKALKATLVFGVLAWASIIIIQKTNLWQLG